MPTAIIGMVMSVGILFGMYGIAQPYFSAAADAAAEEADTRREMLEAQARLNRETLACVEGAPACARLGPGQELVCEKETNHLDGSEVTRCRVEPAPREGPPSLEMPP